MTRKDGSSRAKGMSSSRWSPAVVTSANRISARGPGGGVHGVVRFTSTGRVRSIVRWTRERRSRLGIDGLTLLQGIEVDILEDGTLDLPDAVLEILDFVIASPHVKLRQEPAAMTARMLRAVSHPHVDLIGHPTGRRPGSREGASYDFEAVFRAAAKNGVAVEIDCDPARMDLSPELARLAAECGCTFALSSDAHAPEEFAYVPMAAWMARRAGIPADRIINWSIDNRFKEPSR